MTNSLNDNYKENKMQQFLDVWLAVNSLGVLIWAISLLFLIPKASAGDDDSAVLALELSRLLTASFVIMAMASLISGFMPDMVRFIQ
jgi:hypothetical protein